MGDDTKITFPVIKRIQADMVDLTTFWNTSHDFPVDFVFGITPNQICSGTFFAYIPILVEYLPEVFSVKKKDGTVMELPITDTALKAIFHIAHSFSSICTSAFASS